MSRSSASETPARAGDLGEADLLDRLLGEQRHEGGDDRVRAAARRLLVRGGCAVARLVCGAWVCGP